MAGAAKHDNKILGQCRTDGTMERDTWGIPPALHNLPNRTLPLASPTSGPSSMYPEQFSAIMRRVLLTTKC